MNNTFPAHWGCFRKKAILTNRLVNSEAVSHLAKLSAPSLIWSMSLTQKWPVSVWMRTDPYSNPVVWIRPVSSWQLQRVGAVVIIVFTGAVRVREKDNITGSPFSCCPSPQNTIIVNEKVSLLVTGGGFAAQLLTVSNTHTQGQRSFPELPLGRLSHSWMKRFYITGLPVIVRGNNCD